MGLSWIPPESDVILSGVGEAYFAHHREAGTVADIIKGETGANREETWFWELLAGFGFNAIRVSQILSMHVSPRQTAVDFIEPSTSTTLISLKALLET